METIKIKTSKYSVVITFDKDIDTQSNILKDISKKLEDKASQLLLDSK